MKTIFLFCFLILTSTTLFAGINNRADTVIITNTPDDDSKEFSDSDAGEIIVFSLKENRSTGFTWAVSETNDVLKFIREEYVAGNNRTPDGRVMMGVPGTKKFIYELTGTEGEIKLVFNKKKQFDKQSPNAETFEYTITVK